MTFLGDNCPEPPEPDEPGPEDMDHGVLAGWCATADDLPAARQQTHDTLLSLMGAARIGPVTWREVTGVAAYTVLARLQEGTTDPALHDNYRRLRAHLREYGGWIIVASAPGRPG